MRKLKKKRMLVLTAVLMIFLMCAAVGCGGKSESNGNNGGGSTASKEDLIGVWNGIGNNDKEMITFKKDGSFKEEYDGEVINTGSYTVDESQQTVTCKEKDYGLVFTYQYTLDGDQLTIQIEGGLPRTFQK